MPFHAGSSGNEPFGSRSEPDICMPASNLPDRPARSRRAGRSSFSVNASLRGSALWSPCLNRALPSHSLNCSRRYRLVRPCQGRGDVLV